MKNLPISVQNELNLFSYQTEKQGVELYHACRTLENRLLLLGFRMDYGLDGVPFDIEKIELI